MNIYVRNKILEEKFKRIKEYLYEKGKNGEELYAYEILAILNDSTETTKENKRTGTRERDFKKHK